MFHLTVRGLGLHFEKERLNHQRVVPAVSVAVCEIEFVMEKRPRGRMELCLIASVNLESMNCLHLE